MPDVFMEASARRRRDAGLNLIKRSAETNLEPVHPDYSFIKKVILGTYTLSSRQCLARLVRLSAPARCGRVLGFLAGSLYIPRSGSGASTLEIINFLASFPCMA